MGFLDRFKTEKPLTVSALTLPGDEMVCVVGESHRQPAIEKTARSAVKGKPPLPCSLSVTREADLLWFQALLIREPNNPHDKNAVMVYSEHGHLGYLGRGDAEDYQEVLEEIESQGSKAGACSAFLRKADNGMWGVVLALSSVEACMDDLRET